MIQCYPNLALSFGAVRETSICGLRPSPVASPSSTCLRTPANPQGRARGQKKERKDEGHGWGHIQQHATPSTWKKQNREFHATDANSLSEARVAEAAKKERKKPTRQNIKKNKKRNPKQRFCFPFSFNSFASCREANKKEKSRIVDNEETKKVAPLPQHQFFFNAFLVFHALHPLLTDHPDGTSMETTGGVHFERSSRMVSNGARGSPLNPNPKIASTTTS